MLFDVQAALAEILSVAGPVATPATPATTRPDAGPMSRMSRVSQRPDNESGAFAFLNDGKPASPYIPNQPEATEDEPFPYGFAPNGFPRTWKGQIVSRAEWHGLSEWDRHGSTGMLWNGLTRQWEPDGSK